jgi:hypothetical protein
VVTVVLCPPSIPGSVAMLASLIDSCLDLMSGLVLLLTKRASECPPPPPGPGPSYPPPPLPSAWVALLMC